MKFNTFLIVLFIISTNLFSQEKLKSHNEQNGGCKSHCFKNESIFKNLNSINKTSNSKKEIWILLLIEIYVEVKDIYLLNIIF